jgi:hypothetical protein
VVGGHAAAHYASRQQPRQSEAILNSNDMSVVFPAQVNQQPRPAPSTTTTGSGECVPFRTPLYRILHKAGEDCGINLVALYYDAFKKQGFGTTETILGAQVELWSFLNGNWSHWRAICNAARAIQDVKQAAGARRAATLCSATVSPVLSFFSSLF